MRLGLIGNPLAHSWSPEIHGFLKHVDYELWPLEENELDQFFEDKAFDGLNVTIPYKTAVIKYLDEIDEDAGRMHAVNCIINENGRLKGYNTDILGLKRMMNGYGINKEGGAVAILGTGGASKAAAEACRLSGWEYYLVSRSLKPGCIDYSELYDMQEEISMLINTTPVGMYPEVNETPVDLDRFTSLKYIVDVVANPVRTSLMYEGELRGIKAYGGLEMLVGQALGADEIFMDCDMDDSMICECVKELTNKKLNIMLIGMPCAGKTTVGGMLAEALGRPFIDMDQEIIKRIGMPISEFFAKKGEDAFRDIESDICRSVRDLNGTVIASGGGVIKRKENMVNVAHNCLVVWLDRDPELLMPSDSRPLSTKRSDIYKLYNERKELYEMYSDARVSNNETAEAALEKILNIINTPDED